MAERYAAAGGSHCQADEGEPPSEQVDSLAEQGGGEPRLELAEKLLLDLPFATVWLEGTSAFRFGWRYAIGRSEKATVAGERGRRQEGRL